jgi:phosphatidylinositol alpha-mannosyltransferase
MAAGAPVVAAASGGLVEVIESTGGAALYPAGDAGALAGVLRDLLADPSALAAHQERGRALLAERYSWDAIARSTIPVYDLALGAVARR